MQVKDHVTNKLSEFVILGIKDVYKENEFNDKQKILAKKFQISHYFSLTD